MAQKKVLSSKITELDKGAMKQVMTGGDVFAVGYGDLGSSIYYALGLTALYALGATPIALAVAGLVFTCTALTYAEMSSMRIALGGSSSFSRYAINDLISFIAGWALLLDFIVTIAISAYSAIPYLAYFFPIFEHTQAKIVASICVIAFLFFLNFFGSRHSTRMSWFFTMLIIVTQVILVVLGVYYLVHVKDFIHHLKIGGNTAWSPSWSQFWKGTTMAMVAYTGIEAMAQLTAETKHPEKTVPKAILSAAVILIFMYFGISVVALSAVTPQALSTTFLENPVAAIASALPFGHKILGPWVAIVGSIVLIIAANAGLIGASRIAFRMGEYRQLPGFLYRLNPLFKTPVRTLAMFSVLAILIILGCKGSLVLLGDLYNFGAMLAFFTAHLSLIFLRCKRSELARPFKVPFGIPIGKGKSIPISACVGLIATFLAWLNVVIFKIEGRYLGLIWCTIGVITYIVFRKRENLKPITTLQIEKIVVPGYEKLDFEKILVSTRGGAGTETVQMACEFAKRYNASVTAVHVIEIPFSMSLETPLYYKMQEAEAAVKRAEAIARDVGVKIDIQIIRSRSIAKVVVDLAQEGNYDLIVMGSTLPSNTKFFKTLNPVTEEVIKHAPCKVIVSYAKTNPSLVKDH
jgi:basic amino acid/polyamine antiporter, APA family